MATVDIGDMPVLHRYLVLLAVSLFVARFAAAQSTDPPTVGDCDPAEAEAFLDVGEVRAKILNNGGLFWNGGQNVYEVPKGEGVHSIFNANFLIAGLVDGELRVAGSTYGPFEFWPGPIPEDGSAPTDCTRFDAIYEVRSSSRGFDDPIRGITGDVDNWPVELGAPFIDVGGTPDSYDPDEGDYPEIVGDQMLWWLMNDRGNVHDRMDTLPLGIEVRASVFAFRDFHALGRTTFYRYRIRNTHTRPVRNAYVGLMHDVDLGAAYDDYVGSDTTSGTAYFYNADDYDDENYGPAPPAVGFTVIRRPQSTIDHHSKDCSIADGRTSGLTSHIAYYGGGVHSFYGPNWGPDLYYYLQGRYGNGERIAVGRRGYQYQTDDSTSFSFPGDPVTGSFWSEMNSDSDGRVIQPSDRRSISGLGPFCLGPGDETEVVFAIVWARGDSHLDSVAKMRVVAAGMQEIADTILEPRRIASPDPDPEPQHPLLGVGATLWPNPATIHFNVRLDMTEERSVRISLIDVTGREVQVLSERIHGIGRETLRLPVEGVPPGFYLVRFRIGHVVTSRKLIVTSARPLGTGS